MARVSAIFCSICVAYNITHTSLNPNAKIVITTRPTPLQDKAFKLLAANPACI
ncbi:hypothetical protein SAMN05444679_10819 [Variovorax sp. CF079]|uniref:hypothetical protein n=1 Tax=Variovorax sp. CF079 TaxID=1882774 RepID=UPI00087EE833|nr:hypothetical protein [Variovorax sp. CF079]SDD14473.1 hypothetical protein SAMN05444679_10819 [Variovorax sp. CF079]